MFNKQTENEWPFDFEADDQVAMSFDCWLALSTMGLCDSAVARLTPELSEHYEAAYADALLKGKSKEEAALYAVEALGNPFKANKRYKKTYVTVEALKNYEKLCKMQETRHWHQSPYYNLLMMICLNLNAYFMFGLQASIFWLIAALCILYAKELVRRASYRKWTERMRASFLPEIVWIFCVAYPVFCLNFERIPFEKFHWEAHWEIHVGIGAFIALVLCFMVYCGIYSYRYYKRIEDEMTKT